MDFEQWFKEFLTHRFKKDEIQLPHSVKEGYQKLKPDDSICYVCRPHIVGNNGLGDFSQINLQSMTDKIGIG